MTTRPSYSSSNSRPLSAIFLGSVSSPNNLPDLPEPPPSPGAASNGSGSGLPSPPATNSTGSGSTGDDTANFGSIRHRPTSNSHLPKILYSTLPNANMLNGNYDNETNSHLTTSVKEDHEDDEIENDNDEDNTARLDRRRSLKTPSENILALQRVKSLTERNRLALDKLSTISRLSSPSPSLPNNRTSRSPAPPPSAPTSSSSSLASSRISTQSHSHSVSLSHPQPHHPPSPLHYREEHDQVLSGSETEREGHQSLSHRLSLAPSTSSSDDFSTPPSSITAASTSILHMTTSTIPPDSPQTRPRRQSLPSSPAKELNRTREHTREASPGPSRALRHRLATITSGLDMNPGYDETEEGDLTNAALAAVARSRSPMSLTSSANGKGKRAALPREFIGRERRSLDGRSTGSSEPQTPHRQPNRENTNVYLARGSPSPKASASTFGNSNQPPHSPRGPRAARSSTVRELTRRHQTRWLSEDLSGDLDADEFVNVNSSGGGRKHNLRSGSTESPLGTVGPGRSLVGEGLRAAGIKTKRAGDDVFGSGGGRASDERSQASESGSSRISEGIGPPSMALTKVKIVDPRSSDGSDRRANRASYNGVRPATSMADYHYERDRDRHGIGSSIHARQTAQPTPPLDRTSASPFTTTRRHITMTPLPPGPSPAPGSQHQYTTSEHGRLMLESLQMFESHLSRLPPMGTTTARAIPELFRSAQTIVHASEKLNGLLRAGTNGALEEQIDAEVGNTDGAAGGEEIAEVWRRVGGELRESLRISDEIVRTMTGFLLSVGKVLKETAAASGEDAPQHSRSVSLDEEMAMGNGASPDLGLVNGSGRRSRDGRLSVDSRRSWEPSPRHQHDASVSRRLSTRADARPPSALNSRRDGDGSLNLEGERESQPGPTKTTLSGTVRRLFTPRDKREQQLNSNTVPPTPSGVNEPSPTPASRQNRTSLERARTLPPLAMPPPLPSLPSESILRRRGGSNATDKNNRRKPSVASVSTIRATNPINPTVPTPTTAITTDDGGPFPISRNDSTSSSRTNVTFSRPSTISVSALSGLHVQRKRTISTTSSNMEEISTSVQQVTSPLSGSETERDTRRRTVGARGGARMSLDGALHGDRDTLGRGQPPTSVVPSAMRKERRRTVTEIFS